MKRFLLVLLIVIFVNHLKGIGVAGDNASHRVTVTVNSINELAVSGGNVNLTITSATPESGPNEAADNATTDLNWTTNQSIKKITVETDLASPNFTLKVEALNLSGGAATGEVTLSTGASDFVTSISSTTGSCDLSYTASSKAASGIGADNHTITYTLTDF